VYDQGARRLGCKGGRGGGWRRRSRIFLGILRWQMSDEVSGIIFIRVQHTGLQHLRIGGYLEDFKRI
jgi:hypothetical protein